MQLLEGGGQAAQTLQKNLTRSLSESVRQRSLAMTLTTSDLPILQPVNTPPATINTATTQPSIPAIIEQQAFRREVTPMEIPIMMAEESESEEPVNRFEQEASVEIALSEVMEAGSIDENTDNQSLPPVPEKTDSVAKEEKSPKKTKKKAPRRLTSEIRPPTPEELKGLFKSKDFFQALEDAGLEKHIIARN